MALSVSDQVSPVGSKLIVDTDANATARNDVTGTSGTIYQVDVDNEANSDNPVYFKIYDNASPTVGTTSPDHIFKVLVNQRRNIAIPEGLDFTNLSYCAVVSGGTAGTTAPTSAVVVRMVTS